MSINCRHRGALLLPSPIRSTRSLCVIGAAGSSVPRLSHNPCRYVILQAKMASITSEHLLSLVRPLCQEVDEESVRDFVQRMDEDYLNGIDPPQVARHIRLAARL